MNQNRTETEPKADQNRTEPEPIQSNPLQTTESIRELYRERLTHGDDLSNMPPREKWGFDENLRFFIAIGRLPNPEKTHILKYTAAFTKLFGPPAPIRLDKLDGVGKTGLLSMLEEKSLKKVQEHLMRPPPFSIYRLTSKSSLRRFAIREQAREAKRTQRAIKKQIAHLALDKDDQAADYTIATEKLLKLRLVEASLKPEPDLAETKALVEMLEKIRAGKLAERKVTLAEQKQE